jgi:2-oxoglutarate dehydrogenase E2 component (dihydrolipoamide succinyltransferase)
VSIVDVKVPAVGESITEVVVSNWLVSVGGAVSQDDTIATLETDKVSVDLPAPETGAIKEVLVAEGETAAVGAVLARIEVGAAGTETQSAEKPKEEPKEAERSDDLPPSQETPTDPDVRVMPAAARLLEEHGLVHEDVPASGPGGRLLKEDVQKHVDAAETVKTTEPRPGTAGSPVPSAPPAAPPKLPLDSPQMRHEEVVPMTPLRKRVAERMVESQHTAALLTTFNEIDMSDVIQLRKQHQEQFVATYGVKLGFMSFFVKASIEALKAIPGVNAEIRDQSIVYKNYYDIGIAVGGGRGLVVPVIRSAERLSFAQVETTIADFAKRAEENRIELSELQGGTFTISNGGVFGSLLSTPIVNPPQSGVLGLHTIQDRPVVRDGEIVERPMMYVALTYDHRVVDGREAVTFLKKIKTCVEQPARILLEV